MEQPPSAAWLTVRWPVWPLVAGCIACGVAGTVVFWLVGVGPIVVALAIAVAGLATARWSMVEVRVDAQGVFVRNWFGAHELTWTEIDHFEADWRPSAAFRPFAVARVAVVTTESRRVRLRATTTVQAPTSESSGRRQAGGDVGRFEALRYHAAQVDATVRMASATPGRCWNCNADLSPTKGFCPHCAKNVAVHPAAGPSQLWGPS